MASSGYGESTSSMPFENPSCSSNSGNGDAGDFECNICFDLAQDPIVTLCGHLFCWPCLYKWLHFHSQSQECPVCKALIQEEKLVPLYGRGKNSTDPRAMSIPSVDIPNRPAGQRPETARPPENNPFHQHGFGFVGGWSGIPPVASARFTNFALSASFIGLIPSLFNFNMHGYPDASMYGPGAGYHQYAHPGLFHGTYSHAHHYRHSGRGQQDSYLKMLFLIVAVLVLLTLITA